MDIVEISANYKHTVKKAAGVILGGGLVIYPTDTVYILAVDPTNDRAVKKLLAFKNRFTGKAISVAVAGKKMAQNYVTLSKTAENIYSTLLPGPFTIISRGKHKVARGIEAEDGTLGIRIPDNKYVMDLVNKVNRPITATSANISGRTPHYSISSFLKTLSLKKKKMIDLVVDAGKLPPNKPSTVIDATEPELKVLRRGDLVTANFKTLVSTSERETGKIAEFILNKILKQVQDDVKPVIMALTGDLGCGKTVFSRSIAKLLGVTEKITSPTFIIYNEYPIKNSKKFLHFDLYRLTEKYEFEEIKFLEQFSSNTLSCIEWPENMGEDYLRKLKKKCRYIGIRFEYVDEHTRKIMYEI